MSTTPVPEVSSVAPNARPKALAETMAAYLASAPAIAAAGEEVMKVLVAPAWSGPDEVSLVARAILGDIACASQDYVDDALAAVKGAKLAAALQGRGLWFVLASRTTPAAFRMFEAANEAAAPAETLRDFLKEALLPLENANLY